MLRELKTPFRPLALALLLGLGLGAWGMRLYFDRTLRRWDPQQVLEAQLDGDLHLSDPQKQAIAVILSTQKARMEERRRAWELDVRVLGREGEDSIAQLLDPAQSGRFSAAHERIHGGVERFLWASQDASSAVAGEGR